jgi:hypothetical protein
MTQKPKRLAAFLLLRVSIRQMKKILLVIVTACVMFGAKAQEEKSLQLGLGYGLYCQNPEMGKNFSFFINYKINNNYCVGQMSQFGFIEKKMDGFTANYVNQHLSLLLIRNIFDSKCLQVSAGTGLGYTNYHIAEIKEIQSSDAHQTYMNTRSMVQLSFPVMMEVNFKLSKTIGIGARMGGYIPTQGGSILNYKFLNPQLKFNL